MVGNSGASVLSIFYLNGLLIERVGMGMGWRPQTFPVEPKIVVSRIHRNIIVKKIYLKLKIDKTRAWETE